MSPFPGHLSCHRAVHDRKAKYSNPVARQPRYAAGMALWMVRAGSDGENEDFAIESGVVAIDFRNVGDLSTAKSREDVKGMLRAAYPDDGEATVTNRAGQLWTFASRIQKDDLVALPLKSQPAIAFGRISGPYKYQPGNPPGARHTRPVTWLRTDVPRSSIDQDLLYSFGAFMTVCAIKRNNAEERIRAMVGDRSTPKPPLPEAGDAQPEAEPEVSIQVVARDRIRARIAHRFKGEDFERLIDAILAAQGYVTARTDAGADGGVDIVAGRGPMGFDPPRLAVQVKSSESPEGESAVRELQGVLRRFNADRGLFVSWGGFKTSVLRRTRELFFEVRLWTADDVIDAIQDNYERLPEEVRVEIPLARMWVLTEAEA
ncbi:MAG: restriction endonuclease [Truepera sp.]|nr:restriction endonuclease [Truepera sp.]